MSLGVWSLGRVADGRAVEEVPHGVGERRWAACRSVPAEAHGGDVRGNPRGRLRSTRKPERGKHREGG